MGPGGKDEMDKYEEKSAIEEVATDGTVTDKEATDETHRGKWDSKSSD